MAGNDERRFDLMRFLARDDFRERALSGILILFGLAQWASIIGLIPVGSGVFADQSGAWQIATINLAVAYLVAAVGLWMLATWGIVIWIYAVASVVAMHTVFAGTYGVNLLALALQLTVAAAYMALRLIAMPELAPRRVAELMTPAAKAITASPFAVAAKASLSRALVLRPTSGGDGDGPVAGSVR